MSYHGRQVEAKSHCNTDDEGLFCLRLSSLYDSLRHGIPFWEAAKNCSSLRHKDRYILDLSYFGLLDSGKSRLFVRENILSRVNLQTN